MELKAERKARRKLLIYKISSALVPSAWIGSFLGLFIGFGISMDVAWGAADLWRFPLFVLVMSTILGLPAASIGLLAVGVPVAWLLKGVAMRWWFAPLAGAVGACAGRGGSWLIRAAFLGADPPANWLVDSGVLTGLFAGLLWYAFARNLFAAERENRI